MAPSSLVPIDATMSPSPATGEDRGCVALSNRDLPFGGQLFRPGLRLVKAHHAIPVGTAPLRPILSPKTAADETNNGETNNVERNAKILSHSPSACEYACK